MFFFKITIKIKKSERDTFSFKNGLEGVTKDLFLWEEPSRIKVYKTLLSSSFAPSTSARPADTSDKMSVSVNLSRLAPNSRLTTEKPSFSDVFAQLQEFS